MFPSIPAERTRGALVVAALIAVAAVRLSAAAEHTGEVTFAGAPVPGATVVASQGERHATTTTNAEGLYRFLELEDGAWTIRVEMRGFEPITREVTIGGSGDAQTAPESWTLTLLSFDAIASAGTARAELPAAEAAPPGAAAVSATGQQPGGAQPQRQAQGTTPAAAATGAAVAAALTEEPPANPLFGAADSFLVNGSVMNAAASPFAQSRSLGNVRVNQFLRSPYTFMGSIGGRSAALDARPFGITTRPDNRNINFSGTVGGPLRIPGLIRNGPQFSVAFSRSDGYDARSSQLLLPTALERAGNFSQSVDGFGQPVQIVDPDTGQPFADNTIPEERLSPQARALLAYYPAPTDEGESRINYQAPSFTDSHTDSLTFRLNAFRIGGGTQVDTLNVGYNRSRNLNTTPFAFEDLSRTNGVTAGIGVSRRLTPAMLLRVRNNTSRTSSRSEPFFANRVNVSALAGITGNNQDPLNWGPPQLSFRTVAGLSTGDSSINRRLTNTTVAEVNWSRRRHAIMMGAEVERRQTDLISQQNPRGSFFFDGGETGSDFADFLLGLPRTSTIAYGNADKYFRQLSYAAFITDDFRLSPSLTVNLGVRWEYESPVTEDRGRLVNLDVAPDFSDVTAVVANDPGGALTGRQYHTSLVRPDKGGIQPRVAMAWRPILGSSIIVRAGYGIYRNTNVYEAIAMRLAQQPPLSVAVSAARTPETPITLADGFIATPGIVQVPWAVDPEFRVGYAHNWQAMVQRDFRWALQLSATYVGVKGSHLPQVLLPNTYAPGSENPCPACPAGFQYLTSDGRSNTHRLQLQARRRLRNNIEASGQYTIATGNDNATTFVGIGGTPVQNWLDLDAEYGASSLIRRHEFGGQFRYTSNAGLMRSAWRRQLFGGWVVTATASIGSGLPLTPVYPTTVPGTTVTSAVRPSLTGASLDDIPDGYYANPAAFAPPAPGEWGDAPRGSVFGPGSFTFNGGVSRSFRAGNRANFTWSMNVTNLLNHVTYAGLNTSVGSPQFGLPIGYAPSRRLTTNLQVTFR
jgi:trimeric autotransporter adhesin